MASKKSYRTCFVPNCKNTTISAPQKVFVTVPQEKKRRKIWFEAARRDKPKSSSNYFCCEDHFDLADDMENFIYYSMMGGQAKIKTSVVPHKFSCQQDRKRQKSPPVRVGSIKRRRKKEVEDILVEQVLHPSSQQERDVSTSPAGNKSLKECIIIEDNTTVETIHPSTSAAMEDPSCNAQTFLTHRSIAVQANIRPKYRSIHTMCVIRNSTIDKSCSPIKFPTNAVPTTPELKRMSPIMSPAAQSSSVNTHFSTKDGLSSNEFYLPTSDSFSSPRGDKKPEADAQKILSVTNYFISMNPKAYTGIPSEWISLIDLLSTELKISADDIKMCLLKIKKQDTFERLGEQFCMTSANASIIFGKTIPVLSHMLKTLIFHPNQDVTKQLLPIAFRKSYSHVEFIVDALEIQIEKPSDPVNQALTWSEYKKCNTLKYLISCTPDGFINFISTGYGGRISDVLLFEKCGILDKMVENCAVMADRGFKKIQSLLSVKRCELIKPPSVSSTVKPTKSEVLETKRIASLRIHVERVIGRLREFDFLKPHAVINHWMIPYTDDIIVIASALVNLQTPIIKK